MQGSRGKSHALRRAASFASPLSHLLTMVLLISLFQFELDKNILCDHCRGSGAASDGDVVRCGGCNGQGVKVQRAQVFPGMYTNMQVTCPDCNGKGKVIRR